MVFYRKYRPQTIEELDSDSVRNALKTVLLGQSIPHAFLFTGPKGLGKTSTARIVAKVVNCEKLVPQSSELRAQRSERRVKSKKLSSDSSALSTNLEPCNNCTQCKSIINGSNLDVLEIDAASNRGIDEIRDLREKVRLAPVAARKKVYIIDEVHMLTTEAFNALLKTLEEPPGHVLFILCTTEPQKIPPTIFSRCFHIQFRLATTSELIRSFKRIVKAEKIAIDDDALFSIALLSDGGFRDGTKVLEELVLQAAGKKITKDVVEQTYKIANISHLALQFLHTLIKKDTKKALSIVSDCSDGGVDMKYFITQLLTMLHASLLEKVGIANRDGNATITKLAASLTTQDIKTLVEQLSKAHSELRYAVLPQLPLELLVVEWSQQVKDQGKVLNKPRTTSIRGKLEQYPSSESRQGGMSREAEGKKKEDYSNGSIWQELIEKVKTKNHSIAGVLRGCSLKSYDGKKLVIETGYKFHKDRLGDEKTLSLLERMSKEIAGNAVMVSVVLKEQ